MTVGLSLSLIVLLGSAGVTCLSLYAARVQPEQKELALFLARLGLGFFFLSGAGIARDIMGRGSMATVVEVLAGLSAAVLFTEGSVRLVLAWKRKRRNARSRAEG
jgi:hypothetical protein